MMRVAVVSPNFPIREQPYRGHSTYQIVRRLAHRTELAVFCPIAHYPSWVRPKRVGTKSIDLSYSPPDVEATYFNYPVLPVLSRIINGSVCAHYLQPYLVRWKPDILLNYWLYPEGYAAVTIARKVKVPVIVGAVGSDLNAIADVVTRWRTRQTLLGASFVVTKSEHLRTQAIRLGVESNKVHTLRNGCDTAIFHYRPLKDARQQLGISQPLEIILYVGRFDPIKGLKELIEAIDSLRVRRPRLLAVLAGEGPQRAELESAVRERGLNKHVWFIGSCSAEQVALWMAAADVFTLPSYAEGCPNVVIEALSCGRPIVATQVGGIPELVDERAGILVPPRDAEALAVGLEQALTREWHPDCVSNLFRRSWEQAANELYSVCESVVNSQSSRRSRDTI